MRSHLGLLLILTLLAPGLARAAEEHKVGLSYSLAPLKPLPEGFRTVTVLDSGVETAGVKPSEREARWSQIAADIVEGALLATSDLPNGLTVVKRDQTAAVLREHDMALAGLVTGDPAVRAGKLLAVQGLITSQITIDIAHQQGVRAKRSVDWETILSRYRGRGELQIRPRVRTQLIEEVSRLLTITFSFSLIDVAQGAAMVQYSPPPYTRKDSGAPPRLTLGSRAARGKPLDPVDEIIGELVEQAVRDFVEKIAPVQYEFEFKLVGSGDDGEAAIRALRGDDYLRANQFFALAWKHDPEDMDAAWGVGVTYELLGLFPQALQTYRMAATQDVDEDDLKKIIRAKNRLTEHVPRMLALPNGAAALGGPPSSASPSTP